MNCATGNTKLVVKSRHLWDQKFKSFSFFHFKTSFTNRTNYIYIQVHH